MSCTTQKQALKSDSLSLHRQTLKASDTSSVVDHTVVFDTIHVVSNETLWLPPDTLGRQYPLKTVCRESGTQRKTLTDRVEQRRDTIYVESSIINQQPSTLNHEPLTLNQKTNQWLPWLIIVGMVILSIIIIAIRIFL